MKFSVVLPIHNEEQYLPYSLPSIFRLDPDDVILLFDRCTDNSIRVAKALAKNMKKTKITNFILIEDPATEWNFRSAYLRRYGFDLARNEIILNVDADIILDPNIKQHLRELSKNNVALISFGFFDYPFTIQRFMQKILSKISPYTVFIGQYAFLKSKWKETEDIEHLKTINRGEDTHMYLSIRKKYNTLHKTTKSIHLRPTENFQRHFLRGVAYWELLKAPLWRIILHSFVNLRPAAIIGYLHARIRDNI